MSMDQAKIRMLLVDDEPSARERLRRLLSAFDDCEVVDEAEDGEQAIEKILATKPDLVFLDIQMPGCSGMEVAASLPSPAPRIIFCTAYDEYAVDAFELQAVDYLLKPVNRARLAKALQRVREGAEPRADASLVASLPASGGYPSRFLAKGGSRYQVIPRREVLFFASEEGVTKLQTLQKHFWMQPTLADLEKRLDPGCFCRISRSTIVNLDAVREVVPLIGGLGEARLANDIRLEVSRRRLKPLMERLERT